MASNNVRMKFLKRGYQHFSAVLRDMGYDKLNVDEAVMSFIQRVEPKIDVQRHLDLMLTTPYQTRNPQVDKPQFILQQKAEGLCHDHLLPITYTIHVGYLPSSRWPRAMGIGDAVKHLAHQPITQKEYTDQIGTWLKRWTKGSLVVVNGSFCCEHWEINHVTTDGFGVVNREFETQFWNLVKALT